jgi:hypothetical protein
MTSFKNISISYGHSNYISLPLPITVCLWDIACSTVTGVLFSARVSTCRPHLGLTQSSPIQWTPGPLSPEINRPVHETDQWPFPAPQFTEAQAKCCISVLMSVYVRCLCMHKWRHCCSPMRWTDLSIEVAESRIHALFHCMSTAITAQS